MNKRKIAPDETSAKRQNRLERIRILLADDSRIGCESLKAALARDRRLDIAGTATTASEVIDCASTYKPDIVLLSQALAHGDVPMFDTVRRLTTTLNCRTIMLLHDATKDEVLEAFRARASGIFRRSESLHKLVRCIHAVHKGEIWASSSDLTALIDVIASTPLLNCVTASGEQLLTTREQQVVEQVAQGLTNSETAKQLGVTEHTIKNYLFKIYDKLGISNRVELVLYGLRMPPHDPT